MSVDQLQAYYDNIEKAKKASVDVGVLAEDVSSKVYKNGLTVLRNAAIHEFGYSDDRITIPERSFLRTPFKVKENEIKNLLASQFKQVAEQGKSYKIALGLIGAFAQKVSQGAFKSMGYGTWDDNAESTKNRKRKTEGGETTPLIDTGLLRQSITWKVND